MKTYPLGMVPGPVKVPEALLQAYQIDYGSGDLESDFVDLYRQTSRNLQTLLDTRSDVVIMTGEGMIALWGAMKSAIAPGDRVLGISTGLFGSGIGEWLAKSVGAEVQMIKEPPDHTIESWEKIEEAIVAFKPKMITAVHCETPSGTLNPIERLGALKKKHAVPLLYVDAVASVGGAPVHADAWGVDLLLGGSQKCLSLPPSMSFLSVSPAAWEAAQKVNYQGYDALMPFRTAVEDHYFPYTPYWHGVAMLNQAVEMLLTEGLDQVYARHEGAADLCRRRLVESGIRLYPIEGAIAAPTVTAAYVPTGVPWAEFDARLRAKGLVVGGNYGDLAGKVFRIGHMGVQANEEMVRKATDIIAGALK